MSNESGGFFGSDSADVGLQEHLESALCTTCKGTGLYEQRGDGMIVDVACDCPAGGKRVTEYLKEHPEDR